jgi:hypothetical protein
MATERGCPHPQQCGMVQTSAKTEGRCERRGLLRVGTPTVRARTDSSGLAIQVSSKYAD